MVYISQERKEGFMILQDPDFKLKFNHLQGLAYFLVGSDEKIFAQYHTIQRGREIMKRITKQHNEDPNSVFIFPEE